MVGLSLACQVVPGPTNPARSRSLPAAKLKRLGVRSFPLSLVPVGGAFRDLCDLCDL